MSGAMDPTSAWAVSISASDIPALEERLLDLGPVPIRLGLDDLAKAVPVGAEQSLDHLRPDPGESWSSIAGRAANSSSRT